MQTTSSKQYPRPILALLVLVGTLSLSACYEEACNVVGPSEDSYSHGSKIDLSVRVDYDAFEPSTAADVTITAQQGGERVTVDSVSVREEYLTVRQVEKGDTVTFRATSVLGTNVVVNCVWRGKVGLFFDATLLVGSPTSVVCRDW
jgi:hypothetical protein